MSGDDDQIQVKDGIATVVSGKWYPECIECTRDHGFDIVFTIACFLNGHQRLWIDDKK